jgi:methylglyoxal synthase
VSDLQIAFVELIFPADLLRTQDDVLGAANAMPGVEAPTIAILETHAICAMQSTLLVLLQANWFTYKSCPFATAHIPVDHFIEESKMDEIIFLEDFMVAWPDCVVDTLSRIAHWYQQAVGVVSRHNTPRLLTKLLFACREREKRLY